MDAEPHEPPLFEVERRVEGRCAVVAARGEIDMATAPRLWEAIEGDQLDVVVDLDGCTYLDSSGLNALLETEKRLRAAGGALWLACDRPYVLRLIAIAGLTDALRLRPSVEKALAEAEAGAS